LTAVMPLIFMGGLLLAIVVVTGLWMLLIDHDPDGLSGPLWGVLIAFGLVGVMLVVGPLLTGPVRARTGAIAPRKSKIVS
jgi:hypothetical protein